MEIVAKMRCYHLVTKTNKETNSESIRNPAPLPSVQSIFFSIQCCHNDDRTASFAFVLWIDNGCYGTLVDWILALWETQNNNKHELVIKRTTWHWSKLCSRAIVTHFESQYWKLRLSFHVFADSRCHQWVCVPVVCHGLSRGDRLAKHCMNRVLTPVLQFQQPQFVHRSRLISVTLPLCRF